MLVLTRKPGESIVVLAESDKPICRIIVTAVNGGKVKLGFEAGEELEIIREEIWDSPEVK
jgi:carbon storage regulator CsrA